MSNKASFIYREFYDVPRMLIVKHMGMQLLLESNFDEETDDYTARYKVFVLPDIASSELEGSWKNLSQRAIATLGTIQVKDVVFDPTFRLEVETEILSDLIENSSYGKGGINPTSR